MSGVRIPTVIGSPQYGGEVSKYYLRHEAEVHDGRVRGIRLPIIKTVIKIFGKSETELLELAHADHGPGRTGGYGATLHGGNDGSQCLKLLKSYF